MVLCHWQKDPCIPCSCSCILIIVINRLEGGVAVSAVIVGTLARHGSVGCYWGKQPQQYYLASWVHEIGIPVLAAVVGTLARHGIVGYACGHQGMTLLLMGSAEALPQEPATKPVFMEDMSEQQLASAVSTLNSCILLLTLCLTKIITSPSVSQC